MIRGIIWDIRRILTYTGGTKPYLAACVGGHGLIRVLSAWLMAVLLGNGMAAIQAHDIPRLRAAVFGVIPLLVLMMAISALTAWLNGLVTARTAVNLRESLMKSQLSATLEDSAGSHSGAKLSCYTNDVGAATDGLITALAVPAGAAIMGLAGLVYVLRVHWNMAVVALGIGSFIYLYSVLFAGVLHKIAVRMQELMAAMEIKLKDIIDGMITVRLYGMRDSMDRQMNEVSQDLCDTGIRWARISGVLGGLNNAISGMSDNLIIFAAGFLFLDGSLDLPELMKVSQMAGGIVGVFHVSRILIDVQKSMAGARRIFAAIDSVRTEYSGPVTVSAGEPVIRFEAVTFGYGAGSVIRNTGFTVQKGETVALVGPSGGGKSTILRLIQGLYKPQDGTIEI